jgi:clan AA aspartic protease (TIGR02281 family)
MASSLLRRWTGLVIAFTILGGPISRAQEPAPAATPAAETRPEDLLKAQDLKRSGSTWILASETKVLKDLRDARALYRQVEEGMMHRQQLEMGLQNRKGALEQLLYRNAELGEQIKEIERQSDELAAAVGNVYAQQQRNELGRQRSALVTENNQIVNQLNSIQEQMRDQSQDQDPRLQLNAEVAERREKYMQALIDLRTSVNEVKGKYEALAKNQDVTKALDALSQSTKIRQRLGPSKALNDAIHLLEKSEGAVKTESVTLLRDGGVFHVMATLGKTPTKMVFDTGAGLTTVSANLAKKIGVKPAPGEAKIQLRTADGTLVDGKLGLIPAVRVGKFTVPNVECAVMPLEKGEVDPLLGQSFLKNFKVEFNPDAGKLTLKQVETAATQAETAAAEAAPDQPAPKATAKAKRQVRQPRPTAKAKRSTRGRGATGADADQEKTATDGSATDPN